MSLLLKLARYSLYVFGFGFLGFGAIFLISPTTLTSLSEVALPTSISMMEIRAVYGGFFSGVGLFLLLCTWNDSWLRVGLVAEASIMGGLLVARILSLIVDGAPSPFIAVLSASEIAGFVIVLAALRSLGWKPT
jgi:hypothetical protein